MLPLNNFIGIINGVDYYPIFFYYASVLPLLESWHQTQIIFLS